jgi:hypothetical protein
VRRLRQPSVGGAGPRARTSRALRAYQVWRRPSFRFGTPVVTGSSAAACHRAGFGPDPSADDDGEDSSAVVPQFHPAANRETQKDSAGAVFAKATACAKENAPAFFRCRVRDGNARGVRGVQRTPPRPRPAPRREVGWAPPWRTRRLLIGEGASVPGNALHARD